MVAACGGSLTTNAEKRLRLWPEQTPRIYPVRNVAALGKNVQNVYVRVESSPFS